MTSKLSLGLVPDGHGQALEARASSARASARLTAGTSRLACELSFSEAFVELLAEIGVEYAFGLFGGGIAPFCEALHRSSIQLLHFRHETGAAFAAIEASLASGRPVVVVATTGPGMTNMLTGMVAARWEGAKVIFISGCTPASQRGRWAFQETSSYGMNLASLFASGPLLQFGAMVEDPVELEVVAARLASGRLRPEGFVAHVGLPLAVQTARVESPRKPRLASLTQPQCDRASVAQCAELLAREPFVIWAGFGARQASHSVRALAERAGARVMCSPRAKGVMPEHHPLYLGVTGLGGHAAVDEYMRTPPARALVLGTRLGEFTSFWSPDLVPEHGFVHVDLNPEVFGAAYPSAPTLGVQAEVGSFLDGLLAAWPCLHADASASGVSSLTDLQVSRGELASREPAGPAIDGEAAPRTFGHVRPSFLMAAVQRTIVELSDALVITEAGNAFSLGSHYLRFDRANRYRVSSGFGSMGHATCGVVGAALARRGKAVAIVGDGAMLMMNELSTAAAYHADAIWIVLNDARYNMIEQGMRSIGWTPFETVFPRADFVAIARSLGVPAFRVDHENGVEQALCRALEASGPFLIDVHIDPSELAPTGRRNQSLLKQGVRR